MKKQVLQELIKKKIKEMSSSGDAGGYNTKFAFKKTSKQKPIKEEEVTFTDPKLIERIKQFDVIEGQINELIPLLQKAKLETIEKLKQNPNEPIIYSTSLVVDYMNDLLKMFK